MNHDDEKESFFFVVVVLTFHPSNSKLCDYICSYNNLANYYYANI